ncbi:hypothetical protein K503DRAFT_115567 [Rhizopogon vinicolor AM-OR11-026]|uniref:Uncharacterized protein n=1 Tax=Rhizopogon vinicolor AM-OR11-026 TaxID=1314800 RepID=A0A1B7MEX1_9AGAM|nr:hypothetical protein K503DRAFT_115567 [Rhizopogon vinicolor AM-OR11-026]
MAFLSYQAVYLSPSHLHLHSYARRSKPSNPIWLNPTRFALIEQIRKSPQARAFFQKSCKEEDLPTFDLLQWVRTRWASQVVQVPRALHSFPSHKL